jgi:hypothetical protein
MINHVNDEPNVLAAWLWMLATCLAFWITLMEICVWVLP